jgi:universal stress protein A
MLPIRTILHPTDFSAHSDYAFRLASSLARDYKACLILLHVLEQPLLINSGVMMAPPPPSPTSEEQWQSARDQLQLIKPPDSAILVEHLLKEGHSASAIMQIAQERQCDLIVMGSHGRTGLGRLFMGSVAEQVVRNACCPVLTVKLPQGQGVPSGEVATATRGVRAEVV